MSVWIPKFGLLSASWIILGNTIAARCKILYSMSCDRDAIHQVIFDASMPLTFTVDIHAEPYVFGQSGSKHCGVKVAITILRCFFEEFLDRLAGLYIFHTTSFIGESRSLGRPYHATTPPRLAATPRQSSCALGARKVSHRPPKPCSTPVTSELTTYRSRS